MEQEPNSDALQKMSPEAIQEAQLLLSYAVQRGLEVEPETVKTIVQSKNLLSAAAWTPEAEAEFWLAYHALAKSVAPVTVTGLKGISEAFGESRRVTLFSRRWRKVAAARLTVRRYKIVALIALVFLLTIKIYWLVGSTITHNLEILPSKIAAVDGEMRQKGVLPGGNTPKNPEVAVLQAQRVIYENRLKAGYAVLRQWNTVWQSTVFLLHKLPFFIEEHDDQPQGNDIPQEIVILDSAQLALRIITLYFLPLLYGVLGATVYVLRTLTDDIQTFTFGIEMEIRLQLRIYLGALSGMVVAWFAAPEITSTGISSLSPFALAFLAGYSVEVLFSMLDKFIGAVVSERAKTPEPSPQAKR
jgi:hypothetical protein